MALLQLLKATLWVKIIFTFFIWSLPLLLFWPNLFVCLGFPLPVPMLFVKLLGVTFFALGINYIFALQQAYQGEIYKPTLIVGFISNFMASVFIFYYEFVGTYTLWENFAKIFIRFSGITTLIISCSLGYVFLKHYKFMNRNIRDKH